MYYSLYLIQLLADLANSDNQGFITLEPHLKLWEQFDGYTGPELFLEATVTTRSLCHSVGLEFQ